MFGAAQLLRDVRAFLSAIVREEGKADAVVLASKLAAVGYHLTIRTALGGGGMWPMTPLAALIMS